ncbi:phage-related reverse transcriptase/maturase family protein [Burkholderia pseudomallei]|nr:phage-related reverse transcriptase/maturase family protein [Burkholderia pseudomallei]
MYANEYSQRALNGLIRADEATLHPALSKEHNRIDYVRRIADKVRDYSFQFHAMKRIKVGEFHAYSPIKLGDTLVIRRLNNALRRAYRIKQSDRTDVVRQTIRLLAEPVPKYVIKLDIKSFYESVDRRALLHKLSHDRLLSPRSRGLLSNFFDSIGDQVPVGLPRGISLSATLSEIFMHTLDKRVRQIDGIYFAARYVDDLIIFSTIHPSSVIPKVEDLLPTGMRLNKGKCKSVFVGCRCTTGCIHTGICPCIKKCSCTPDPAHRRILDYLGYRLSFNDVPAGAEKKNGMTVTVGMSSTKVKRYKTRVVLALRSHIASPDFQLLRERIRFLCENTEMRGPLLRGKLKTGIRFNYPLINDISELVELDDFLRSQLGAVRGKYGASVAASMSSSQKRALAEFSFRSGHQSCRSRRIHATVFSKIKACWQHA